MAVAARVTIESPKLRVSSAIGVYVSGMSDAPRILVPDVVSVERRIPTMAPASDDVRGRDDQPPQTTLDAQGSDEVQPVTEVIVLRAATSAAAWRHCAATIRRWFALWPPQIDVELGLDEPGMIALAEALGEAAADAWLAGVLDLGWTRL